MSAHKSSSEPSQIVQRARRVRIESEDGPVGGVMPAHAACGRAPLTATRACVLGIFISAKMEIAISLLTPPPPHRLRMRPPPVSGSHPACDAAAMLPAAMNLAAP